MSSTKPEVQYILHCNAPEDVDQGVRAIYIENLVKFGRVIPHKQTDRHAHHNTLHP